MIRCQPLLGTLNIGSVRPQLNGFPVALSDNVQPKPFLSRLNSKANVEQELTRAFTLACGVASAPWRVYRAIGIGELSRLLITPVGGAEAFAVEASFYTVLQFAAPLSLPKIFRGPFGGL